MGQPAAKQGDKVQSVDIHIIMVPSPGGPVPTPIPHQFNGTITSGTSANVMIEGMPAATTDSMATNLPPHIPMGPGPFMNPPSNQGTVMMGSMSVMINNKPAARMGDMVRTCNDPVDLPTGTIVCSSRVMIGGPAGPGSPQAQGGAQVVDQNFENEKESTTAQTDSKKTEKGKGSLNVQALDVEGNPVADCDYEIVLPSGERKKGKTNSDGMIDEQGIDPGNCEVHFYPDEASESA